MVLALNSCFTLAFEFAGAAAFLGAAGAGAVLAAVIGSLSSGPLSRLGGRALGSLRGTETSFSAGLLPVRRGFASRVSDRGNYITHFIRKRKDKVASC